MRVVLDPTPPTSEWLLVPGSLSCASRTRGNGTIAPTEWPLSVANIPFLSFGVCAELPGSATPIGPTFGRSG